MRRCWCGPDRSAAAFPLLLRFQRQRRGRLRDQPLEADGSAGVEAIPESAAVEAPERLLGLPQQQLASGRGSGSRTPARFRRWPGPSGRLHGCHRPTGRRWIASSSLSKSARVLSSRRRKYASCLGLRNSSVGRGLVIGRKLDGHRVYPGNAATKAPLPPCYAMACQGRTNRYQRTAIAGSVRRAEIRYRTEAAFRATTGRHGMSDRGRDRRQHRTPASRRW